MLPGQPPDAMVGALETTNADAPFTTASRPTTGCPSARATETGAAIAKTRPKALPTAPMPASFIASRRLRQEASACGGPTLEQRGMHMECIAVHLTCRRWVHLVSRHLPRRTW